MSDFNNTIPENLKNLIKFLPQHAIPRLIGFMWIEIVTELLYPFVEEQLKQGLGKRWADKIRQQREDQIRQQSEDEIRQQSEDEIRTKRG